MMHHHQQATPAQTEGRLIRWASYYDFMTNILTLGQAKRLRTMTIEAAGLKVGESVLDVGCGTGGVTLPAKQRVGTQGRAAGIDPAPEMIAVAGQKARRKGLEIEFRVGVIEALPYPEATFDVVTSSLMMHHLPEQLKVQGLREVCRVLKPGGRLLIVDLLSPKKSAGRRFLATIGLHAGLESGIEDYLDLMKAAGFSEAVQLEKRFFILGFARGVK